jgi:hypothetical protein
VSNKDQNFDSLAKGLAEGRVTRGRALKMLGAAIFGGALTTALPGLAFGQGLGDCPPARRCHGTCCPAGQECQGTGAGSSCGCPTGTVECANGTCFNCSTCTAGQICDPGTCGCVTPPAQNLNCGGKNQPCCPESSPVGGTCNTGLKCNPGGKCVGSFGSA